MRRVDWYWIYASSSLFLLAGVEVLKRAGLGGAGVNLGAKKEI